MTQPIINIYRTTEEAFYFENSQMNRFYSFNGVQLLPFNENKYVQVTNTPDGIDLEDWTVFAVDMCTRAKTDITEAFMVESLTNSENGDPQLFWSLTDVQEDFGMNLIYLEVQQSLGETFYSTPFLLTSEEEEKTTQFTYKAKRTDSYQSIGFQTWFRQNTKQTELTTYYEASTKQTVTQAVKTNKIAKFASELMDIDQLIALSDVLENPYLYVNNIRASLFEAVEIPEVVNQEIFGSVKFNISFNNNDVFDGNYIAPVIIKPVAVNDTFDVPKTGTTNLLVLLNDDLGNQPTNITQVITTGVTQGSVAISTDKQYLIYTGNNVAIDGLTCTYTITDSKGYISKANVTINAKTVVPAIQAYNETISLSNVGVQNIYPLENDSLGILPTNITAINTTGFTGGTIAIVSGGQSLSFTPNGTTVTNQTFTYTITDSTAASSTATITISVTAVSITYTIIEDRWQDPCGSLYTDLYLGSDTKVYVLRGDVYKRYNGYTYEYIGNDEWYRKYYISGVLDSTTKIYSACTPI